MSDEEILAAAGTIFPVPSSKRSNGCGASERSQVSRVRVRRDGEPELTVIVKAFTGGDEGWPREAAGLSALPSDAPAPTLVGAGREPPFVVIADLGAAPNVADHLLGPIRR